MKQFATTFLMLSFVLFIAGCGSSSTEALSQSINLQGVGNARELGGYKAFGGKTVKHGVFLRTAALSGATEDDIRRLHDVYHLAVIADLRLTSEINSAPDPEIPGAKNINLDIIGGNEIAAVIQNMTSEDRAQYDLANKVDVLKLAVKYGVVGESMYIRFLSGENGRKNYSRMFQELLALPENSAFLFHCSQGKDRTGCAAMLILSALGADEDTIMYDYVLTNTFNAKLIESQRDMLISQGYKGEELDRLMKAMDEVDPQYMVNALDWMKDKYGSVMGYINQELGVTDEQIDALRAKFLD